jgi:hypothetical protein
MVPPADQRLDAGRSRTIWGRFQGIPEPFNQVPHAVRPTVCPTSGHQGGTKGAHDKKMLWDNKASWTKSQKFLKGVHDSRVRSDASLESDGFGKRLAFAKVGYEISGKGVAKPCNDIGLGRAFLQEVDHVAFGKDTTSARDSGGMFGAKGESANVFNRYPKAVGLKIEKRACAGRTHLI